MNSRSTLRALFASALVAAVTLIPATVWAASCTIWIEPEAGQAAGHPITVRGSGWPAGQAVYVNMGDGGLNSEQIVPSANVSGSGTFSYDTDVPVGFPVGVYNLFAANNNTSCEVAYGSVTYEVTSQPFVATTTTTTTTTLPPTTTTVAATTTTAAATTTTVAAATTTTVAGDTTTTTVADSGDEDGGGGFPIFVWVVIAVLGGAVVFLLGKMSSRGK